MMFPPVASYDFTLSFVLLETAIQIVFRICSSLLCLLEEAWIVTACVLKNVFLQALSWKL